MDWPGCGQEISDPGCPSHGRCQAGAPNGQLQAVSATAPAHIIEAMVDQEQAPAAGGVLVVRQGVAAMACRHTRSLILHLPDQPARRLDAANPQAFARITAVAMAHGIDQGLLETQMQLSQGALAAHRLQQQLHERSQLQCGGSDEIGPTQRQQIRIRSCRI